MEDSDGAENNFGDCPMCRRRLRIEELLVHASTCEGGNSDDRKTTEEDNGGNYPQPEYGDCPMCTKVFLTAELLVHAAVCQGRDNGGEGLVLNELDEQEKCGTCSQLIPVALMEEHGVECWQLYSNRRRVQPPKRKR